MMSYWNVNWKHFSRYWPFVRGIHVTVEFPSQRPVTRSFDVFFDPHPNKRLGKQSRHRVPVIWLRRHCAHYDVTVMIWSILVKLLSDRDSSHLSDKMQRKAFDSLWKFEKKTTCHFQTDWIFCVLHWSVYSQDVKMIRETLFRVGFTHEQKH